MTDKGYYINLERVTMENAVYNNGEFICFEDDYEAFLENFNLKEEKKELQSRNLLWKQRTNKYYRIATENANRARQLEKENKELKTELLDVLKQLFNADSSLIHEQSTTISQDEEELREYFKQKYGKYGWK